MKSSGKCSYVWGCGMTSPSWLPDHCYQPQGFHILGEEQDLRISTIDGYRSRKWRDVLKGLLQREGRRLMRKKSFICCHSPKATNNFGYDAVSYSKNFDDGQHDAC